jgi:hypothetical protein
MPSEVAQKFEHMFRVSGGAVGPPGHGVAPGGPSNLEEIKWLYDVLTILDSKAGALLAFDGLLLAAETLMYDKIGEKLDWLHLPSLALIVITLADAVVCLFVAQVSYAFLGKIELGTYNNTAEIEELGEVVEARTRLLWVAWVLSIITVFLFIALVMTVLEVMIVQG